MVLYAVLCLYIFQQALHCAANPSWVERFLENSIRRFGMAFHHRNFVDRIVDNVISLEALLVPGVGDSTLKLAHRMASLLGDSDKERREI